MEYNYNVGIVLFIVNILTVSLCIVGSILRFNSAIKAESKRECDLHFMILFFFIVFMVANSVALYTGIKAFLINPSPVRSDLIEYRLVDRTCMLIGAIIVTFVGQSIRGVFDEED